MPKYTVRFAYAENTYQLYTPKPAEFVEADGLSGVDFGGVGKLHHRVAITHTVVMLQVPSINVFINFETVMDVFHS